MVILVIVNPKTTRNRDILGNDRYFLIDYMAFEWLFSIEKHKIDKNIRFSDF